MKTTKTIIASLALIGFAVLAHGQGQVTFANTGSTLISTNVNGLPRGPTSPALGGFVYALFAAPSTVTTVSGVNDPNWTFTGAYATNTFAPTGGRLAGGQPVLPGPYASGTTWNFLVRGWSTAVAGLDWTAAQQYASVIDMGGVPGLGQVFGTSAIGTFAVGGSPYPIPTLFGTGPGQIPGFDLRGGMPEPSRFALFVLGGAALIISRRRDQPTLAAPKTG